MKRSVEEALSILNNEAVPIDLESLEQWCDGDNASLPLELKQVHPHKAVLFYLWTGQRCQNQMLRRLLDEGWHEKAVALLDDDNQETYRMVILGIPVSRKELLCQAVSKMRQHRYTLDSESFKKLFSVVNRVELIECYKEMVAECSTAPDEEVCQFVLEAMAGERTFPEACELVKQMVARGFKPRKLQALFRGLLKAGKHDDAYNVLDSVDGEEAHNDLIVALDGEPDKTIELVKRMLGRGYKPSMRLLFDRLLATGRDKDAYAALEMVGCEEAHCDFIGALIKVQRREDAYDLVKDVIRKHPQHIGKCFNTLVHKLFEYPLKIDSDEWRNVMEMLVKAFDLMDVAITTVGFTPDLKSWIAVVCALEKAGRRKEASYISTMFVKLELIPKDPLSSLYRKNYERVLRNLPN